MPCKTNALTVTLISSRAITVYANGLDCSKRYQRDERGPDFFVPDGAGRMEHTGEVGHGLAIKFRNKSRSGFLLGHRISPPEESYC